MTDPGYEEYQRYLAWKATQAAAPPVEERPTRSIADVLVLLVRAARLPDETIVQECEQVIRDHFATDTPAEEPATPEAGSVPA